LISAKLNVQSDQRL